MTPCFVTIRRICRSLGGDRLHFLQTIFYHLRSLEYVFCDRMSGVELALAIVPLVIVLIQHHQTIFSRGRALTSSRFSNDQQREFYQGLHVELSLLNIVLSRVHIVSTEVSFDGIQTRDYLAASIQNRLGDSADNFQQVLDRILKSMNDLVRDESSTTLTQADTVSATLQTYRSLHRIG
jgi:hypothetical protein